MRWCRRTHRNLPPPPLPTAPQVSSFVYWRYLYTRIVLNTADNPYQRVKNHRIVIVELNLEAIRYWAWPLYSRILSSRKILRIAATVHMLINYDGCLFLNLMSQELLVTLSLFIAISHFPPEIKTMITVTISIVPVAGTEPGGTASVTAPIWMAFIMTVIPRPSQMLWTGLTGRDSITLWRGPRWK